jgi:hypothetical protein
MAPNHTDEDHRRPYLLIFTMENSIASLSTASTLSPFRVLGIALVVEEKGKGAALVVRYPVSDVSRAGRPSIRSSSYYGVQQQDTSTAATTTTTDNLFFTLPPRVMAKLFRPKKPLCGQPLTLNIGNTTFCCRAVLFDDDDEEQGEQQQESPLVLLNVIVALVPTGSNAMAPLSGWADTVAATTTAAAAPDAVEPSSTTTNDEAETYDTPSSSSSKRYNASLSILAIRRVHVSLARLGRVLEREERRCRYVSLQSENFLQIAAHFRSQHDERNQQGAAATGKTSGSSVATDSTATTKKGHRRKLSGAPTVVTTATDAVPIATPDHGKSSSIANESSDHHHGHHNSDGQNHQQALLLDRYEREQELLELLLAAAPPNNLHGNLAGELVDVFHALSRNEKEYTPTPSVILSGSQGIVYIHSHLAVPIEPASTLPTTTANGSIEAPRPYHTLLFPHTSPTELVATLSSVFKDKGDGRNLVATPQQRLQQLLLMASPRKSLQEMSVDTLLPLKVLLDMAQYLVKQNACVLSPVLTRNTRLACCENVTRRMQELSLAFSQRFQGQSIFIVTSLLTSKRATLGEVIISLLAGGVGDSGIALISSLRRTSEHSVVQGGLLPGRSNESLEDLIYAMAVWLRAHQVIVELEEFLVAVGSYTESSSKGGAAPADANKTEQDRTWNLSSESPEELLFQELVDADALTGRTSTAALCWRFGLTPPVFLRFRSWGLLHNKLRIVVRIAQPDDDS